MSEDTQEKAETKVALNIRGIPPSIRQEFKTLCAKSGKDMQRVLIEFMEDACVVGNLDYKLSRKKS